MQNITPNYKESMDELIHQYDLFIIDQWGVIHNGVNLLKGAKQVFQALRAANKKIAILSNSGKPADFSIKNLDRLGIEPDLYDFMLTSGEHAKRALTYKNEPFYADIGQKYYMFGWNDYEHEALHGLNFKQVKDITEADFILCAGFGRADIDAYKEDLTKALTRNIKLICINSDLVTVAPDGGLVYCPGMIAQAYEQMGGPVRWHGKPDSYLYKVIGEECGGLDKAIAIGDSLEHDIKGANAVNIASCLITNGIHRQELPQPISGDAHSHQKLQELSQHYGATPNYFMPHFSLSS